MNDCVNILMSIHIQIQNIMNGNDIFNEYTSKEHCSLPLTSTWILTDKNLNLSCEQSSLFIQPLL